MLRVRPLGSPTFKSRSRRYPDLVRSPDKRRATIGSTGSTASGSGTGNTIFASAWPTRRPIAKGEKDWSIGFAKCITTVSGVGIAENHSRILDQSITRRRRPPAVRQPSPSTLAGRLVTVRGRS
jgi:hypothetical protein